MGHQYRHDYDNLSDGQIVDEILAEPHNEEAAAYMLYDRYSPLLHSQYYCLTKDDFWYEDCVEELFLHLKGKDGTWHRLASFEWRSTFGGWLRGVAWNKFHEVLSRLIENGGRNESIDNDDPEKPQVQIPNESEESHKNLQRKIILMEAIGFLEDDLKFVILKRYEGYSSKQIAELLKKRWQKYGIIKYNKKGKLVIPDFGYVDNLAKKARAMLKKIMSN